MQAMGNNARVLKGMNTLDLTRANIKERNGMDPWVKGCLAQIWHKPKIPLR